MESRIPDEVQTATYEHHPHVIMVLLWTKASRPTGKLFSMLEPSLEHTKGQYINICIPFCSIMRCE